MNLSISYNNQKIPNGEYINIDRVQSLPEIRFTGNQNECYTLVMFDSDAPNPGYLHYMRVNICDERHNGGQTIVGYIPPNPTHGETHHYNVLVYRQTKSIDRNNLKVWSIRFE